MGTVQYRPILATPSPYSVIWYKYDDITSEYVSIELQTPAVDLHLQEDERNDDKVKEMEQEIECPRCADMMTLSSEFDRLGYVCHECDLLLVMK
jgi:ribosomal protein S27AE